MNFFQSVWSFLSVVIIAWITQRIGTYWDKRKKVEEKKLATYISWMPFLAECYSRAFHPDGQPHDAKEFLRKKIEILGTLQIMGPLEAMDAFSDFCDLAEKSFSKDPSFDAEKFHRSFTRLNHSFCCEIHGERNKEDN
ncbi:MAG TPA: hypothetical protein VI454_12820 [Verrucomicrobiae bacterium]|jgi:hypothetical protein